MARYASFEKLIVRQGAGYVCDETALVNLSKSGSYDGAMFKLITKCETSMLLLTSHNTVDQFTVDVVVRNNPEKGQSSGRGRWRTQSGGPSAAGSNSNVSMAQAWLKCEAKGFHGLQAVALIDESCMPDNGCKLTYSVAQYVNSLIHGIEAYFMFQKPSPLFALNTADLWQTFEELKMESCYIVMVWKFKDDPREETSLRSPLIQLNTSPISIRSDQEEQRIPARISPAVSPVKEVPKRKSLSSKIHKSEPINILKRGRASVGARAVQESDTNSDEDEDEEISFKKRSPPVIPQVKYLPNMSPKKSEAAAVVEPPPEEKIEDITFGFERLTPKTPTRKSTGRKSLIPDWPEALKDDVLRFFDNLNPKQTEQTCIALTCKFASMKYDRELPSKLLYQWVQKKGRVVEKTVNSYDLPENEQKETMVNFFKSLNPDLSETSRVAFTCKFMHTQFDIAVQSKQLYSMLNEKGKKATKRR
ncbi:uncharacterized protein [Procambarus clarkii]|uniref:uncharacterized protein n=1 Tax=Procambarus clarkii TaxID=6728 RepID=UPI001E671470|nr:uncharacterized protein LOC123769439 [Procambarus clarkii]